MNISFEIISKGSLLVHYHNKTALISGELVFSPPVFYADLSSLIYWQPPYEMDAISQSEKSDIISFLISQNTGTKIVFD
ncbi:MAG: hypothetical protein MUC87_06525 [Bacteroidia bacterium]|jgi:hypothetical protein|nr:hypothetical protein [Bacteroidia bacterium]